MFKNKCVNCGNTKDFEVLYEGKDSLQWDEKESVFKNHPGETSLTVVVCSECEEIMDESLFDIKMKF